MTPRRLTPSPRKKVWGATRLEPWFRNSPDKIGEVWLEGVDDLPLLVKFLFTSDNLSVQVHPNDAFARAHHNCRGKSEMWHILAAEPGAKIAAGFRETLSAEQVRAAALSGEIVSLLKWFDAAPGDTFFIPAGTVHAIGAGLTLCEIQQNSDVTYRLYDYGRPRELHLDQALAVSHRGPHPARQNPSSEVLVSCDHFVTKRRYINGRVLRYPSDRFQVLIAIHGNGQIGAQPTKTGDAWYIPPRAPAFDLSGNLVLLETSLSR